MKKQVQKYNIVCGQGQHKSYTACLAELMMLNKYGNQQDYFWRQSQNYDEYVKFIKLAGKLSKGIGRDRFAFFLYKNPKFTFNDDIGLIIYKLKADKNYNPEFTLGGLIEVYKNMFRPQQIEIKVDKVVEIPKKNTTVRDFLGDI
jgi:hypothetical protein